MPETPIRVLCVDDHRIVREGIALIIAQQPDMAVVGMAGTGEAAITLFKQHRPDITLMDLRLESMSGLDAIRAICAEDPAARVIALTMYQGDEDIHRALTAGAAAYVLKSTLTEDMIRVVREVYRGERPMLSNIKATLEERTRNPPLTPREIQVLSLIAKGMRNKEVADVLGISIETVPVHLRSVFLKLGVNERTSAVNLAVRRGIVHIE